MFRIAFYVVLLILANFSFINRLFSILWYQPHMAEPCYAGYAVFFTQLLHQSFRNAPFFAASGAEIYPVPFKRLFYFFPVRRWRDRLESSHAHGRYGPRKDQRRAGGVLGRRRDARLKPTLPPSRRKAPHEGREAPPVGCLSNGRGVCFTLLFCFRPVRSSLPRSRRGRRAFRFP